MTEKGWWSGVHATAVVRDRHTVEQEEKMECSLGDLRMIGLTASVAMQVALLATSANAYQDAYNQADKEGKPLLVLVGADWCPGCRTMKQEMIPELERDGGLSQVVFTTVNTDEKPTLSRRLLHGTSIPQLVLFTRTAKGWRRSQLTGVQVPGIIRQFIKRETVATREASSMQTTPASTESADSETSRATSSVQ
jgi:thioredoxin-like negative regulator of GroEL